MATFQRFYDNQGKDLGFIIGSPLCGSPISVKVKARALNVPEGSILTFHRIMVEVKAGLSGLTEGTFITQQFMAAVESAEEVEIDISSALRSVADNYEYTCDATTYPRIKFQVKAWDVYRLDGSVYDHQGEVTLPDTTNYYYSLLGKYSDMERIMAGYLKLAYDFCNKPKTSPQLVCVGETFAYTPSFTGRESSADTDSLPRREGLGGSLPGYSFNNLPCGPTSEIIDITFEGEQQIGDITVYALPEEERHNRVQFRFINRYGVLDSYSCTTKAEQGNDIESENRTLAMKENFGTFSRGIMQRLSDKEWLTITTGPLEKDWLDWVRHEFLTAEHSWIFVPTSETEGLWLRCLIEPEDSIKAYTFGKPDALTVSFKVRLDINGSINPNLAV